MLADEPSLMSATRERLLLAVRDLSSWALVLALVIGGMAFLVDGALLLVEGGLSPARTGLLALAAMSQAALLTALIAPAATILSRIFSLLKTPGRWGSNRGWVPPLLPALAAMWLITSPLERRLPMLYLGFVLAGAGLLALFYHLASRPLGRWSAVALFALASAMVLLDCWLNPLFYPELHMLAHFVAAAGFLALLTPLRRRLTQARLPGLLLLVATLAGGSILAYATLQSRQPDWPILLRLSSRHGNRLQQLNRRVSTALGRPSGVLEQINLPPSLKCRGAGGGSTQFKDSDLGLGPAVGDPAYTPGTVDLVILITVECFRPDALTPAAMPRLWKIAGRGASFLRGYAASSKTRFSLPPIFGRGHHEDPLISAKLRRAGVATSAVVGFAPASKGVAWGKDMGFDSSQSPGIWSSKITDMALARIQRLGARKHFVWLHYWEPHTWYRFRRTTEKDAMTAAPTESALRYLTPLKVLDRSLARLFQQLQQQGRMDRTLVIITGDHGEALGEEGLVGHGHTGKEVVFRVPMVAIGPGLPAGQFDKLSSHHDIPHTVLGAFGLGSEDGPRGGGLGRSWLRLRGHPEVVFHDHVVARSYRQVSGKVGVDSMSVLVTDRFKLHYGWKDEQLELFDLPADPGEQRNLAQVHPEQATGLLRQLATFCLMADCADSSVCEKLGR